LQSRRPAPVSTPTRALPVFPSESFKELNFPLKQDKSLDGIISYLTPKHGGNVHDKGIVTISAKSVDDDEPKNFSFLADPTADSEFGSKNEPGQWVCWNFHEMRVRLTHYTIKSLSLKSWVVESSLNCVNWTELDRKTDNESLKSFTSTASLAVANSGYCRFIRLAQTGKTRNVTDMLAITHFEFFGTLLE
jgi:hypothetical protein